MVKDPVCGMMVDEQSPAARTAYQGKEYFFCHKNCKEAFEQYPEQYIGKERKNRKDEPER